MHGAVHLELLQAVLAHIKRHPHVVHQGHVHHGSPRAHQFAHLREDVRHLAVGRGREHRFGHVTRHLAHGSLGARHHGGRRILVLTFGAVHGHVVLRLGGLLGSQCRVALRRHFVEFLRRGHALVVKAFHTVVRLLRQLRGGAGLLPHFVGGLNLLLPCALLRLAALRGGSGLGGLSLTQFSLQVGRFEYGERVAGMHIVALAHHEAQDAAGHLARHAVFRHIGFSLRQVGFVAESVEAADNYKRCHTAQRDDGRQKVGFLSFHNI